LSFPALPVHGALVRHYSAPVSVNLHGMTSSESWQLSKAAGCPGNAKGTHRSRPLRCVGSRHRWNTSRPQSNLCGSECWTL